MRSFSRTLLRAVVGGVLPLLGVLAGPPDVAHADDAPPSAPAAAPAPTPAAPPPAALPPIDRSATPPSPIVPTAPPPAAPSSRSEEEWTEPDPDDEPSGPGRPGLLAGGIVLLVMGSGVAVADGFAISDTVNSHVCTRSGGTGTGLPNLSPLACAFAVTGEFFLTVIAVGTITGGTVMTVIGSQPKKTKKHRRRAPAEALERPGVELGAGPGMLQLRGRF